MIAYIAQRLLWFIPTLFAVSIVSFAIIQLPPGDYLTVLAGQLAAEGEASAEALAALERLRDRYGLDQPFIVQYAKWIWAILSRGDFGYSFEWRADVSDVIGDYMVLTVIVTGATLLLTW